jgi:stage II sporulation protein AA (anti-sigma F factor antagonist)
MQLSVARSNDVTILRVQEAKLTYPTLSAFMGEVRRVVEEGTRALILDLGAVTYVDSASIGCLMDIRRLLQEKGGVMRLCALQPRVETMISMTGVNRIIEVHRDEAGALQAFRDAGKLGDA